MPTLDDLLLLLPDNSQGAIDAVDLREIVVHLWGKGDTEAAATVTALALKADKTELNQAVADLEASLGTKVNSSTYTAGLATKANVDDVYDKASADSRYARRAGGARTIVLGDSIDAGADSAGYYSGGSIFSRMCVNSDQKMTWLRNSGISGNTTTQALARVQADVIDHNPGICIFGGGVTNDHGAGMTHDATRANLIAIADALDAAGIRGVVRLVPPTNNAGGGAFNTVALRRAAVRVHNAWARVWAQSRGYPVLDYYTPVVDDATGGYVSGTTDDGIHPNVLGYTTIADAVLADLPRIFDGSISLASYVGDPSDLLAGVGLFKGTPSGGLAAGWSGYGNDATLSVVSDAAIPGNWQKVTGGTSSIRVYNSNVLTTGFTEGDIIEFSARVRRTGASGAHVRLRLGPSSSWTHELNPAAGARALDGIAAARIAVPVGTTRLMAEVSVNYGETFEVAQVTIKNLTALGVE